jgi:hypothetical protein
LFFLQHLVQGVAEANDGTGVLPFRVDTWVLDEGVIRPIDEGVGVNKE